MSAPGRQRWSRPLCRALAVLALALGLAWSGPARADGLVAAPGDLAPAVRAELAREIAAARLREPAAFAAVAAVSGYRPERYRSFRHPAPTVTAELVALGRAALWPMLEELVFAARPRGSATDAEWEALAVGMLQAVGRLRDPRAAPAVRAAFLASRPESRVAHFAARALGDACDGDEASRSLLAEALGGARLRAAIAGLGQCRGLPSARLLAAALEKAVDPGDAILLAAALGAQGSSWAWRALGVERQAEGEAVRAHLSAPLGAAYFRFAGETRRALARAIRMVEHPALAAALRARRAAADAATVAEVERLIAHLERAPR
ncbi:MAG: hypothetical protein IT373_22755 [Polyangiaceae bacterium]|nr:hypothetical protein [Polyangiaceae bacterium]